ncbi:MAG: hypothetical protein H6721_10970 [Sandaracinus sp.]|nr:hypothetical protein [Sandaracinus sp.]MCB9632642.1 hypothetical protein [Sandaracinus sp.]
MRVWRFLSLVLLVACSSSTTPPGPGVRPSPPPTGDAGFPEPTRPDAEVPVPSPAAVPSLPVYGGHGTVVGDQLFFADPERDLVSRFVIEGDVLREAHRIELPAGSVPFRAVGVATELHVTLRGSGRVARVAGDALVGTYEVCRAPRGIAWDAERGRVLVACAGGELVALDPEGHEQRRVMLEPDLRDVVVDDTGAIFVSVFRAADVLELDVTLAVRARHALPDERATDPTAYDLVSEDRVANTAWRMRATPGGGVEVLHQLSTTRAVQVAPGEEMPPDHAGYGAISEVPVCVRPVVSNALTRLSPTGEATSTRIGGGALAVDFVRTDRAYLALAGVHDFLGPSAAIARVEVIVAPTEVGTERCVGISHVQGAVGGGVAVEALFGRLVFYSRDDRAMLVDGVWEALPEAAEVRDLGHTLFHGLPGVQITCASCHAEGRDDGLVWDFGEGPRRTQSLLGGIGATAPFHWRGDVADFGGIMERTFAGQMGGFVPSPEWVALVESWLDTLEVDVATVDSAAAERGAVVFAEAGCPGCHQGALGTQPESVELDGSSWQVPMLRGVGLRAPFFHDGCASTLRQALDGCADHAVHPGAEALSAAQRDDLAAFLAAWD